jgi:hypothetical protein
VNIICFVILSSWKVGRKLNGAHAAPGRQVSTWVHAAKAEASARVGGFTSHSAIIRLSSFAILASCTGTHFSSVIDLGIITHSESQNVKVDLCIFP